MGDKCNCPPAGAPDWVLTYGDMMSLLLCFFIMLVAMSEIKKEERFEVVAESVQKAFGSFGGGGKLPTEMDPTLSLIERLEKINLQQKRAKDISHADDPGVDGKQIRVTKVREGQKFVVGGKIIFEPGSAVLSEQSKKRLLVLADLIRGYNHIVEVAGHAATNEVFEDGSPHDLTDLSYARAKATMDFLCSDEVGIRVDRVRVIANGDREPVRKRTFDARAAEPNRRVEIVVTESLVEDYKPEADTP